MAGAPVSSYSKIQIWLHWSIAALILVQFLAHDGMQHVWRALRRGQEAAAGDWPLAYMHVVLGLAVLVLAAWRLWLRRCGASLPCQAWNIRHYGCSPG